jgi:hypothetical protein
MKTIKSSLILIYLLIISVFSYAQNRNMGSKWVLNLDVGGGYAIDASPMKINQRISNTKNQVPINQLFSSCGFRFFDKMKGYGVQFHIQDYYGIDSDTKRSGFEFKSGLLLFQPQTNHRSAGGHMFFSIYFAHCNNNVLFQQSLPSTNVLLPPELWIDGVANLKWKRRAIGTELIVDSRDGSFGSHKSSGPYVLGLIGFDWSLPNSKWYANNLSIETMQAERGFMVHIGAKLFLQSNN